MRILKGISILVFFFLFYLSSQAQAITLVSFNDYDFSALNYSNRVRLSGDVNDQDFLADTSIDSNNDGIVDHLEENTFALTGESATLFLGNGHNSYDIANALFFVGIDGNVDSFSVNALNVNQAQFTPVSDPSVYFSDASVAALLDQVVLFEIGTKLEDREPNDSPVGANAPFEITLSDIVSQDTTLRMYCGAYGFIASGVMNSYTPQNSDVVFIPTIHAKPNDDGNEENPTTEPVPEPTVLLMFGTAVVYVLMKERRRL
jgi:hypothetical protein